MGSLRFLGNPHALMPCSLTPAGPTCQAIAARRHGPCGADGKGSHKAVFFRGSIAGPRRSLSTLRSRGCPRTTQDSLPVAGQALPDGIGYPQDSTARFPGCFLHHFPLSQACPDAAARQPTGPPPTVGGVPWRSRTHIDTVEHENATCDANRCWRRASSIVLTVERGEKFVDRLDYAIRDRAQVRTP